MALVIKICICDTICRHQQRLQPYLTGIIYDKKQQSREKIATITGGTSRTIKID
jgi:hypothetical protein